MRHKQKGAACACSGMEMLGFPKSGGFMSLFGGQEQGIPQPTAMNPTQPMGMTSATPTRRSAMRRGPSNYSSEVQNIRRNIDGIKRNIASLKGQRYSNNSSQSPGLFGGRRKSRRTRKVRKSRKSK